MSYKFASDTISSVSSAVASFNSSTVDMQYLNAASFQLAIDCTGVSWTASLQHSNDGVTFIDITTPTAVTNSANLMMSVTDAASRYYRVAFVRTSGTLTSASVVYVAKG